MLGTLRTKGDKRGFFSHVSFFSHTLVWVSRSCGCRVSREPPNKGNAKNNVKDGKKAIKVSNTATLSRLEKKNGQKTVH